MPSREVISRIKFAIQDLKYNNSATEFEKLCSGYVRAKICENIIVSTAGGIGDGGIDFQNFKVFKSTDNVFVGKYENQKVIFACSLKEKIISKVKGDIDTIKKNFPYYKNVYFFAGTNIPTDKQNSLKNYAMDRDIYLEIMDLQALATVLSDYDLYYLVFDYLGIPSNIYPQPTQEKWYTEYKNKYEENEIISLGDFLEVKNAIRESVAEKKLSIDIPFWLKKLNEFHDSLEEGILKYYALYEICWATLRGLDKKDEYRKLSISYMDNFKYWDNPSLIENANCILSYADTLDSRETNYPEGKLKEFKETLSKEIDINISKSSHINSLQFMYIKLVMLFHNCIRTHFDKTAVDNMLLFLKNFIKKSKEYPYFPMSTVLKLLSLSYEMPEIRDDDRLTSSINDIEKILEEQEGKDASGDYIVKRIVKYFENEQYYRVIEEGHKLKEKWFREDTIYSNVLVLNTIGEAYQKLNMGYAAKYYFTLAAYICVNSSDISIMNKSLPHIYELASIEYALGNWFAYFNILNLYFMFYYALKKTQLDLSDKEQQHLVYYASLIYKVSTFEKIYQERLDQIIKNLYCDEQLKEDMLTLLNNETGKSLDYYWEKYEEFLFNRPFNDMNKDFNIKFTTSGINWNIKCENVNDNFILTEEVASIFQICLIELNNTDIQHLKIDININIIPEGKKFEFEIDDNEDNSCLFYNVKVPTFDTEINIEDFIGEIITVFVSILDKASLLDSNAFLSIVKRILQKQLFNKIVFYTTYRKVYSNLKKNKDDFYTLNNEKLSPFVNDKPFKNNVSNNTLIYDKIIDKLDVSEIQRHIKKRYENTSKLLDKTFSILKDNEEFKLIVKGLKQKGYTDCEIYNALANIFMERKMRKAINVNQQTTFFEYRDIIEKKGLEIRDNPEKHNKPLEDNSIFLDKEELSIRLDMNYMFEMNILNLSQKNRLPKIKAIEDFLINRCMYRKIDVEHESIETKLDI